MPPQRRPDPTTLFAFGAAAASVLVARLITWLALGDVPHVMDEVAYLFEARTFLAGHLTLPVATPRAAFALWLVDDRFARYAVFPPGFPLALAAALRLHVELWLNPLLHGATALAVGYAARALAGKRAFALGTALYAFSPQALLLAASLMSQSLVAFAASVIAVAGTTALLSREQLRGPARSAAVLASGLALGAVAATRPLCAVVLAVPAAILAVLAWKRRRLSFATLLAGALPLAACVALLLAYNHAVTGKATRFPQTVYFEDHGPPVEGEGYRYRPGCNDLGLGESHGCDATPHTLSTAIGNTSENLKAWFLLAGGGPLVFLFAVAGVVAARDRVVALALALPTPIAIVAYSLYWNAGTCYGARFYHAALPGLVVLAAVGVDGFAARWARAGAGVWLAWGLWNVAALGAGVREISTAYFGTDDRFAKLAATWNRGNALVMVAFGGDGYPVRPTYRFTLDLRDVYFPNSVRALSALWLNTPALDGPVVFAKYHPALVPELRARFPERALYLYVVNDGKLPQLSSTEAGDWIGPYDDSAATRFAREAPYPRDNFDGFIVHQN